MHSTLIGAAAVVGLLTTTASDDVPAASATYKTRVGDCRVAAIADLAPPVVQPGHVAARRSISFLVGSGRSRILVAGASLPAEYPAGPQGVSKDLPAFDAVILPYLDDRQAARLLLEGRPALPGVRLIVDRSVFEEFGSTSRSDGSALARALAAYRDAGLLQLAETDLAVAPGVRLMLSPARPNAEVRIRFACGASTLIIMNDDDLRFAHRTSGAPSEPRLARRLVSDGYTVGTTNGAFPGLGHVYLQQDGYHWGSVQARTRDGVQAPRVTVDVLTDES